MITNKPFTRTPGLLTFFSLICILLILTPPCEACFSIIVGKDASADGFVIMAHNEDDGPPQIVNHHKVLRKNHPPSSKIKLRNGGQLDQAEQTFSYIWSEMPGMNYSDSFINEWGVSVTSDNCPSREDKPQITDGGIGYMLRALIAQRAKTARQGVLLAGRLVERFGYIDPGRTYIIADPHQGWLFSVVKGKHWLAKRVPDNEVAMVANTYTIHQVDLSDTDNFLASKDIIDYAVQRGWYKPDNGPVDFAKVYADPIAASHPINIGRQWRGLNCLATQPVPYDTNLPLSLIHI